MSLFDLISVIEQELHVLYFFRQAAVILVLFLAGYMLVSFLCPRFLLMQRISFSFPAGLGIFAVTGELLLVLGIPYRKAFLIPAGLLTLILLCALHAILTKRGPMPGDLLPEGTGPKQLLLCVVLLFAAVAFACSGILSVTVSNDSLYKYLSYPRAIVYLGGLSQHFDTYLTDVGQGCAVINTLPFLFGFDETFGIQHALNLSFLVSFCTAVSQRLKGGRYRILCVLGGVFLLLGATPYLLLSKWVLANDYFAVYLFLCAYLANTAAKEEMRTGETILQTLLILTLSLLRIEGGVYAALLLLCISILPYVKGQLCGMLLPVMTMQILYFFRIFATMEITAPYRFMTQEKAVIVTGLLLALLLYFTLLRDRVRLRTGMLQLLLILLLAGCNLALCLRAPSMYLNNTKVFLTNVLYIGGWGVFPVTVAVLYLISVRRDFRFSFYDLVAVTYLLYVLAVTFMRGDELRPGVGDSGNRVLLQAVLILFFAAYDHVSDLFAENMGDENGTDQKRG